MEIREICRHAARHLEWQAHAAGVAANNGKVGLRLQDLVGDPLAEQIIGQHLTAGATITADVKNDEIFFSIEQAKIAVPA